MNRRERQGLARARLANQGLLAPAAEAPAEVVSRLGAVQGQDFLASLWAIGQRLATPDEAAVEQAANARTMVRTWPLRHTLHWVAAGDARWLLALTAPRAVAAHERRQARHYDITPAVLARARRAISKSLRGGEAHTRSETMAVFEDAGIATGGQRGYHILWRLALDGLICFGARRGKQATFVLFDEWLAPAPRLDRPAALAELGRRYFRSHGPATLADFAWWSGLPRADALAALEAARPALVEEVMDGRSYWGPASPAPAGRAPVRAYLLPVYDEYAVAYADRSALLDAGLAARPEAGHGIFYPPAIVGGRMVGTWKRTLRPGAVEVEVRPFAPLAAAARTALRAAARRYGEFLARDAEVRFTPPRARAAGGAR